MGAYRQKPLSVVQDWVSFLSLKQQTVLLCALRGCDGVAKEDPSKQLVRFYRASVLLNAAPKAGDFMRGKPSPGDVEMFCKNLDHYPMHWLLHFMHGAEILGYKHGVRELAAWWRQFYKALADALHLRPESEEWLDHRLSDEE